MLCVTVLAAERDAARAECDSVRGKCDWLAGRLRRIDGEYRLATVSSAHPPDHFFKGVPSDYFIEIVTACNLRCPACAHGHPQLFQRKPGKMELALFRKILAKIRTENPAARISPYHQSEPFLHPELPEFVRAIKEYGFSCEVSSNLNVIPRLDDFLLAGPDQIVISLSGFTQAVYARGHVGGDIEKVKRNMRALRDRIDHLGVPVRVAVNYHMYRDNVGEDFDRMKQLTCDLRFDWHPSWARSICTELTVPYLEARGKIDPAASGGLARPAWLPAPDSLPPAFFAMVDRLAIRPEEDIEGQEGDVSFLTCPSGGACLNIRVDGSVDLCGYGFDDRQEAFPDYLQMTPAQLQTCRTAGTALCATCLRTSFCLRSNYTDMAAMDRAITARLPDLPADRRMAG